MILTAGAPRPRSPDGYGFIVPKTKDGRVVFVLPWLGHTIAGTTDQPTQITTRPEATAAEVSFILDTLSDYLSVRARTSRLLRLLLLNLHMSLSSCCTARCIARCWPAGALCASLSGPAHALRSLLMRLRLPNPAVIAALWSHCLISRVALPCCSGG